MYGAVQKLNVGALALGLVTIQSGGTVLFVDGAFREDAGQYVPFVVWSNFLIGFLYVIAGIGLWMQSRWAVRMSIFIVATTAIVFAALGIHILQGGGYEVRTIIAMSFRTAIWLLIVVFSYRNIT